MEQLLNVVLAIALILAGCVLIAYLCWLSAACLIVAVNTNWFKKVRRRFERSNRIMFSGTVVFVENGKTTYAGPLEAMPKDIRQRYDAFHDAFKQDMDYFERRMNALFKHEKR